jgi:antitoxin PrlF
VSRCVTYRTPEGKGGDNAKPYPTQCECITIRCPNIVLKNPKMRASLEVDSTLTDRYQTTVPEPVRRALKLGKRDKIHYVIQSNGAVLLTRASGPEGDDPVLGRFLGFLAQDMAKRPQRIESMNAELVQRIKTLVAGVSVDLDAPLSAEDE